MPAVSVELNCCLRVQLPATVRAPPNLNGRVEEAVRCALVWFRSSNKATLRDMGAMYTILINQQRLPI